MAVVEVLGLGLHYPTCVCCQSRGYQGSWTVHIHGNGPVCGGGERCRVMSDDQFPVLRVFTLH